MACKRGGAAGGLGCGCGWLLTCAPRRTPIAPFLQVLLADLPLVRELNMAGFDHDMLLQVRTDECVGLLRLRAMLCAAWPRHAAGARAVRKKSTVNGACVCAARCASWPAATSCPTSRAWASRRRTGSSRSTVTSCGYGRVWADGVG